MRPNGSGLQQFSGGIIQPLMNRTLYDFSYLLGGASETINLAKALNVGFVTSVVLVCRIHVNNIASGATLAISCFPTAPSGDDPAEFSDATADLTVSVTTQTAPFYLDASLATPPKGGWWKVDLKATQPGSPVNIAAQLSAFLVLRN